MMKICYLINSSSIHAERLIRYFAWMGHEIHAVGFEPPKSRVDGVHYHVVPANKKLLYFTLLFKLVQFRSIIKKIKPEIVDAHYVIKYGFIAALTNFHPLVVTAWGSDILIQPKQNPVWHFVAKYTLKKADLIVCRSPFVKEEILKLGVEASKIRIILLGVNTEMFHPMPKDEKLKQELGIEQSEPVVISTRSLSSVYNVETLLKAVPLVLAEIPEAKFVIIGKGEQEGYLRNSAQSLDILESVKFIGWVPHTEISRYLSSSDIYVSTSLSDGTSNSLLEAMACELAPVVTNIPANQQWVEDGVNGFLVPVKNSRELAKKIIYLIKNEKERVSFSEINRKIVQEKAEQKREMEKLEKAYQDLMAIVSNRQCGEQV